MAQIGTFKLETGSGTVDVPVFDTGDSGSNVHEYLHVQTASGVGFIPLADPADATHNYLRVQTQNNGIVAVHDDVLASIEMQYYATKVSADAGDTVWPDDKNTADMTLEGGPEDITMSDGKEAVRFRSSGNENGLIDLPSSFEGNSLNSFSVEMAFQTFSFASNDLFGTSNINDDQRFQMGINTDENNGTDDGNFNIRLQDTTGSELHFAPENNPGISDSNRHNLSIIIDDASNNNVTLIIDGDEKAISFSSTGGPSSFGSWEADFAIAGRANTNGVFQRSDIDLGAMRWHNTNISSQTISDY